MNRQQLRTALRRATTTTFEELALLVVDAVEPPAPAGSARPPCGVRVDFDGPFRGSVVLRVAEAVVDAAAANMLGISAAPDAEARRDALGELANVICGNLLPEVAGRAAVFALRAPRWIGARDAERAEGQGCVDCALDLDEGAVHVALLLPSGVVADAHESAVA